MLNHHQRRLYCLVFMLILAVMFYSSLTVSFWWDEGWTVAVARNYLEFGHFGQINGTNKEPIGLSQSFVVIWPIITSIKLFGLGIWQARLPSVIFSFIGLILLWRLARNLFDERVANIQIGIILLTSFFMPFWGISTMCMGEPLAFLMITAAILILELYLRKEVYLKAVFLVPLCLIIATFAKPQIVVFLSASLILTALLAYRAKQNRRALFLILLGITPIFCYFLFNFYNQKFAWFPTLTNFPIPGLIESSILVLDLRHKLFNLKRVLVETTPHTLAISVFCYLSIKQLLSKSSQQSEAKSITRIVVALFCCLQLYWFLTLSVGFGRYLYPCLYWGSLFTAYYIAPYFCKLGLKDLLIELIKILHIRTWSIKCLLVFLTTCWITYASILQIVSYRYDLISSHNTELIQLANSINSDPEISGIESHESEVFPFLKKPYHFPPNSYNLDFIRRFYFDDDHKYTYPLGTPHYSHILIGEFGEEGYSKYLSEKTPEKVLNPYLLYRIISE